jgi:hypothetical protein
LDDFLVLATKYEKFRTPFYNERYKIINNTKDEKFDGVPSFWYNVLKNSELQQEIKEHDIDSLKHLLDIKHIINEKPKGYSIEFHFSENPYFNNKVLKKSFIHGNNHNLTVYIRRR